MADLRESFPSLEDGTGAGSALSQMQEGDAVAAKNGSMAFSFKDSGGNAIAGPVKLAGDAGGLEAIPVLAATDNAGNLVEIPVKQAGDLPGDAVPVLGFRDSSGNLVAPQLTSSGQVPVSLTAVTGDGKKARGTAAGSATLVTVASLTLANSKIYENLDAVISCFRDALFQVILSDNAVETIVAEALCGPGQLTSNIKLEEAEITTGATGTQLLLIKAMNLNALSDFRAALSVKLTN